MSNGDVFRDIAGKYDRLNTVLSLGQDQAWRKTAARFLPEGRVLDLGGGTGAANPLFLERHVVALDPAREMLEFNDANDRVVGVGERLPFVDGAFDGVFSAYVLRNLDNVGRAMAEVARVLRPGGIAAVVDLARPPSPWVARLHRMGTAVVLPLAGATIGATEEYAYLHRTLDKLPPPDELFADVPLRLERTWRLGPLGFVYGAVLVKV